MYAVKIHMRTHNKLSKSNENLKHKCGICGAVYARIFALRYHMKEQHAHDLDVANDVNEITHEETQDAAAIIEAVNAERHEEDEIATQRILQNDDVRH